MFDRSMVFVQNWEGLFDPFELLLNVGLFTVLLGKSVGRIVVT